MDPRTKSRLVFGAKVLVAAVLVTWLVRGGALDFKTLGVYLERPVLVAAALGLFACGIVVATVRWRVLLALAGVDVPLRRLFPLQVTAVFFNVVIPGNVGGDVIKNLYVARDAPSEKRTTILLTAFAELVLGLVGLIGLGMLTAIVRAPALFADRKLAPLAATIIAVGAGMTIGVVAFVVVMRLAGKRLDAWTSGPSRIAKLLNQLVLSFQLMSADPRKLAVTIGLSMIGHAFSMAFFTAVTRAVTQDDVSFAAIATVYPFGLLTLVLPISPAGFGVGHLAFDGLFEAIGLSGGANVFNVYLCGIIAPCLLGVFPYLSLKRTGDVPDQKEAGS